MKVGSSHTEDADYKRTNNLGHSQGRMDITPGRLTEHHATEAFRWPGVEAVMEAYQRHAEGMCRCCIKCFVEGFFFHCSCYIL